MLLGLLRFIWNSGAPHRRFDARKAETSFVCARGDPAGAFQITEEVLYQMSPFVHLVDDPVAVGRFIRQQRIE